MRMKPRIHFALYLLAAGIMVSATSHGQRQTVDVTIAGNSSGGQSAVFGESIVAAVRRSYPGSSIIYEPGNPAGALMHLRSGRRPFALVSNIEPNMAYEGRPPFKERFEPNTIKGVMNIAPRTFALMVYGRAEFLREHGIRTFHDLVATAAPVRLSINQPGQLWVREHVRVLFAYYGEDAGGIERRGGRLIALPTQGSHDLMRDRRLDVVISGGIVPSGALAELASAVPLASIELEAPLVEAVAEELGNSIGMIPKGAYSFLDRDLTVPMSSFLIVAGPSARYEDAYRLARALYEQMDAHRRVLGGSAQASREEMPRLFGLELHEGAEAFYREVGLLGE